MRDQTKYLLILIIVSIIILPTYYILNEDTKESPIINQETEPITDSQIEDKTGNESTETETEITEHGEDTVPQNETISYTDNYIELPIGLRIVTSSDWSTLTFANGEWCAHHIIVNESIAEAYGDEKVIGLSQSLTRAMLSETVEVLVNTSVRFPQTFLNVDSPKLVFTIKSGDLGWTYVEVINMQNKTASIIDNYWLSDSEKSSKPIFIPISNFDKEPRYTPVDIVDASSLHNKALFGYQGWFGCPHDGSDWDAWFHWFTYDDIPNMDHLTVDFWPDMTEYGPDQRYPTDMVLQDGSPAELFSSYDLATVDLHFRWMEEYGLDGVIFQRFVAGLSDDLTIFGRRNKVLQNVQIASERHGRVFFVQYDFSGSTDSLEDIKRDWMFLVDVLKVSDSPNYVYHNGKPVLGLWGVGFNHIDLEPDMVNEFLQWIQIDAPERYRATILGGVPTWWRTLSGDSHSDPAWREVYERLDIICPWTVGRYQDKIGADAHLERAILPDMSYVSSIGKEYMTVIWPGFSWHNMFPNSDLDFIPRDNGEFIWRQAYNVISSGSNMVFIAMFDEVDEGTAMFKLARADQLPVNASLVAVNVQEPSLQSDHYLVIGNKITQMLHGDILLTKKIP